MPEYDDLVGKIIFCAPSFRGLLGVLRMIGVGKGTPADMLISDAVLRRSSASMPAPFQLLPAPPVTLAPMPAPPQAVQPGYWPTHDPTNKVVLRHPTEGTDLYDPCAWLNKERPELRDDLLEMSAEYHREFGDRLSAAAKRPKDKMYVIVGLNGETNYAAKRYCDAWEFVRGRDVVRGKKANGDGTALFQSSHVPELEDERHWAFAPDKPARSRHMFLDHSKVVPDLSRLIAGETPIELQQGPSFFADFDWQYEMESALPVGRGEHLRYIERSYARAAQPPSEWHSDVNPPKGGRSGFELFSVTRSAARLVVTGMQTLDDAAKLAGVSPDFLEDHIRALMMPQLFG